MPELTGRYRNITPRTGHGDRFTKVGELPRTIRPFKDEPLRLKAGVPDEFVTARRGTDFIFVPRDTRAQLEARAVPIEQVYGSVHERIVYKELLKRRLPFDFQSSLIGPRRESGSIISDFVLLDRPLIISVEGNIWHRGVAAEYRDILQDDLLNAQGWEIYTLRDIDVEQEALLDRWFWQYIDLPIAVTPPTLEMLNNVGLNGSIVVMPSRIGVPPGL